MDNESFEEPDSSQKKNISRVKEELEVKKKKVSDGKVVIKKKVVENEETLDIDLQYEKVTIERFPKDEILDKAPAVRKEGNKTIIPVVREVLVKKLLLVEEVHLEKKVENRTSTVKENLKEEQIDIQRESEDARSKTK